ncbi:MAG TPA: GFA family protein [Sphingobium sp.]|nr:GFA family protein [Sphingobium sp.]
MPTRPRPSFPQHGGCQCGALRYELRQPPLDIWACHCNQCRKQSGSAFGMSMSVAVDALCFVQGEPALWTRRADAGHLTDCLFCASCGSRIAHRRQEHGGRMTLKPGTLNDTGWIEPRRHVFTDSALDWIAPLLNHD